MRCVSQMSVGIEKHVHMELAYWISVIIKSAGILLFFERLCTMFYLRIV